MKPLFNETAKNPPKSIMQEITSIAKAIYGSEYLGIDFSDEDHGLFVGVLSTSPGGGSDNATSAMIKSGFEFRDVMSAYNEKTGRFDKNSWAVFKTKKGDWK